MRNCGVCVCCVLFVVLVWFVCIEVFLMFGRVLLCCWIDVVLCGESVVRVCCRRWRWWRIFVNLIVVWICGVCVWEGVVGFWFFGFGGCVVSWFVVYFYCWYVLCLDCSWVSLCVVVFVWLFWRCKWICFFWGLWWWCRVLIGNLFFVCFVDGVLVLRFWGWGGSLVFLLFVGFVCRLLLKFLDGCVMLWKLWWSWYL